jgi:outer membrane protein TolC
MPTLWPSLALARHAATAAREELVRQLGLDDAQTALLKLPDRLPDLPEQARTATELSATAMQQRLDVNKHVCSSTALARRRA